MHPDNLKYSVEQIIILMEMAYIEPSTFKYMDYTVTWGHRICEDSSGPHDKIDFTYLITGGDLSNNIINTSSVDFNETKKLESERKIFDSIPPSDFEDTSKKYAQECVYMLQILRVEPGTFCTGEYKISWNYSGNDILMMSSAID